jgi:hypothetical protein
VEGVSNMTDLDIYKMEHDCIVDLCLSDCNELSAEWKTAIIGYIDGLNTMAGIIADKMKEANNAQR